MRFTKHQACSSSLDINQMADQQQQMLQQASQQQLPLPPTGDSVIAAVSSVKK